MGFTGNRDRAATPGFNNPRRNLLDRLPTLGTGVGTEERRLALARALLQLGASGASTAGRGDFSGLLQGLGPAVDTYAGTLGSFEEQRRQREKDEREEERQEALGGLYEQQTEAMRLSNRRSAEALSPAEQRAQTRVQAQAFARRIEDLVGDETDPRVRNARFYAKLGDEGSLRALTGMLEEATGETRAPAQARREAELAREIFQGDVEAGVRRDPSVPSPDSLLAARVNRELAALRASGAGSSRPTLSATTLINRLDSRTGALQKVVAQEMGLEAPIPQPVPEALQQLRLENGQPPLSPIEYRQLQVARSREIARERAKEELANDLAIPMNELTQVLRQGIGGPATPQPEGSAYLETFDDLPDERVLMGLRGMLADGKISRAGLRAFLESKIADPSRVTRLLAQLEGALVQESPGRYFVGGQ